MVREAESNTEEVCEVIKTRKDDGVFLFSF